MNEDCRYCGAEITPNPALAAAGLTTAPGYPPWVDITFLDGTCLGPSIWLHHDPIPHGPQPRPAPFDVTPPSTP